MIDTAQPAPGTVPRDHAGVFITGDSHTGAMHRGLARLVSKGWDCGGLRMEIVGLGTGARLIKPFFRDEGTHARMVDPDYQKRVPALPLPGDDHRSIAYGWSGLFHFAKVWRDLTWETFRPSFHAGPRTAVSTQLLESVVLDWFGYQLKLLEAVRRSGARVFVIESPRPFRHHPALTRLPPDQAVAIDGFCRSLMAREILRRDVGLVRIPAECVDEDGFMRAEWRSAREDDEHHGSTAYGALMVREVARYVGGSPQ